MMLLRHTLLLIVILSPYSIWANTFSAPILNDAYQLLETRPERSLEIAKAYIDNNEMAPFETPSEQNVQGQIPSLPIDLIEAYQIEALAYQALKQEQQGVERIKKALVLAKKYQLDESYLESKLIYGKLQWLMTQNNEAFHRVLTDIEQVLTTKLKEQSNTISQSQLYFDLYLNWAELESIQGNEKRAEAYFNKVMQYGQSLNDPTDTIDYHMTYGAYFLKNKQYEQALSELLTAYWLAIEKNKSGQLAQTNALLGELFYQRGILDKALEHASQSAEFYSQYGQTGQLSSVLRLIAHVHLKQENFNLALVQLFNVLEQESQLNHVGTIASVQLDIAETYYLLKVYALSQHYLDGVQRLNDEANDEEMQAKSNLLQAKLNLVDNNVNSAITHLQQTLLYAQKNDDIQLKLESKKLLSETYQKMERFKLALKTQREYEQLFLSYQATQNAINQEAFRQQKGIIEQSLHAQMLEEDLKQNELALLNIQKLTLFLVGLLIILFFFIVRKQHINQYLKKRLRLLLNSYYSHPRSGLQNLRLLVEKLPISLQQSSANIELSHLSELIHEPLNDRLRFSLFTLPSLNYLYIKQGYTHGLTIEKKLGEHLSSFVHAPNRLYHFSDSSFLYVEERSDTMPTVEELVGTIQECIDLFPLIDKLDSPTVHVGIVEYPFLPKAYMAIDDHQLIDILLIAINHAHQLSDQNISDQYAENQWVYFRAIDNAPAASFANDDMPSSVEKAIEQGLIKVYTSKDEAKNS